MAVRSVQSKTIDGQTVSPTKSCVTFRSN